MSTQVKVQTLRPRDVVELPSGSLYDVARSSTADTPARVQLWCAHPTDPTMVEPARVDMPHDQMVGLLSQAETRLHVGHAGYTRTVFAQAMDRQHQERMQAVYAARTRAQAAAQQHQPARRPWWQRWFR